MPSADRDFESNTESTSAACVRSRIDLRAVESAEAILLCMTIDSLRCKIPIKRTFSASVIKVETDGGCI